MSFLSATLQNFVRFDIFTAVTIKISHPEYDVVSFRRQIPVRQTERRHVPCSLIGICQTIWRHITELVQNKSLQLPRSPNLRSLILFSGGTNRTAVGLVHSVAILRQCFSKPGSAKGCQGFREKKMRNGGTVILAVQNLCV